MMTIVPDPKATMLLMFGMPLVVAVPPLGALLIVLAIITQHSHARAVRARRRRGGRPRQTMADIERQAAARREADFLDALSRF